MKRCVFSMALSAVAAVQGRSFCHYPDEAPKVSDAKLRIDALAPEHDIYAVLQRHLHNLARSKLTMAETVAYVVDNAFCRTDMAMALARRIPLMR